MPRSKNNSRPASRSAAPPRKKKNDATTGRLRVSAEKKIRLQPHAAARTADPKTAALIHELQVHQIELEMQNEELRATQRTLEDSQKKFSDLFDFSPVGYLSLNDAGTVVEVNATAQTLLVAQRSELIGKPFHRVIHPKDKDLFYLHWNALIASAGRQTGELRLKTKGGLWFPAQLISIPFSPERKPEKHFLIAIFDISLRRKSEDAIKRNEARLESLYKISQHSADSIPALLDFSLAEAIDLTGSTIGYIYHYDDNKKEFSLNSWSQKVMHECSIVEKQTVYQLEKTGIWGEAVRQAKPIIINDFHAQNPLKKGYPDGHAPLHKFATVPVFLEGRIVGVIGVANKETDYTDDDTRLLTLLMNLVWKIVEHKQSEKVLSESREDLNRAQAVALTGSWRMDVQRNVLVWSDENHRIFGIPKGTPLTYETFLSRVHPDDREYVDCKWTAALKGEPYSIEHRIVVNGAVKWVHETAGLEFDDQGRLLGGFGTTQDISATKKREQELARLNRTLKALSNSSQEMVRATDETSYLQRVCDIIVNDCGHAMVWIGYAENDKDRTIRPVAQTGIEKGFLDRLHLSWADNDRGRGPTGTAIRTGKNYLSANIVSDPSFASWRDKALEQGYASSISIPLIADTSVFGAMTIFSSEPDAFTAIEVKLLQELTDDLAYGIKMIKLRAERIASENALRSEHTFINTILQNTGGLIVVLDPEGRIKKFNRACELATGYSFDEVNNRTFWDFLLLPEEVEPVKSVFMNLTAGAFPSEFENYWVHRDGTRRFIRWMNSAILDENGRVSLVIGTGIDITDRKKIEQEIWNIARFPEQNPNPILRIGTSGTLLYINPVGRLYQEEWGLALDKAVPNRWLDLTRRCIASNAMEQMEVRGGDLVFLFSSVPLADMGYVNLYAFDITSRLQMESELAEKRRLLENLVKKQSRVIIDTKENLDFETQERIRVEQELTHRQQALEAVYAMATAFNSSFVAMNDQVVLNVAKILNTPFAAIFYFLEEKVSLGSLFLRGELVRRNETTIPCSICLGEASKPSSNRINLNFFKNNHLCACFPQEKIQASISVPLLDSQGEVHGMICALDEIERTFDEYEVRLVEIFARYLSHEQSRRELESQLVRANEMKMLGLLTSGVAHEVRNPLNGIMAIVGALVKELGDAERFEPYLHHLRNQVTRLTTLMEDLLALGRPIREEKKVELPVIALVQNALLSWQLGQKQHKKVLFTPPNAGMGELLVRADGASIEQVIINLLENAHQHSGPEKEVMLSIETEGPETIRISVRDRGPGIPKEILSRIFDPFFTTRKGGTGLGLSIIRHIVESHGGTITARNNEEGAGATFTINLPQSRMNR